MDAPMNELYGKARCRNSDNGLLLESNRLKRLLLELLDIPVDALQLLRNVDSLRAVRRTLVAADAVTRLPQFRNTAVVSDQVGPSGLPIIFVLCADRNIPLVEAFVVVQQDCRNIQPVGAGHAVFAVVARNRVELHHHRGHPLQKSEFFLAERLERTVCPKVVLNALKL